MINETFKQIRMKALGLSSQEMATKLNMPLSEYEQVENENPIPLNLLIQASQATGISIDALLHMRKEKPKFEINDKWTSIYDFEQKISNFVIKHRDCIDSESVLNTLKDAIHKPKVAFIGRSDVGKSTLINSLLDNNALPVSWTPTTSIIIYVKHIKERPTYIKNQVLIFKANEKGELWDDTKLADRKYTESYTIASGEYSLLADYGSRQGNKFEENDAASAVVFVNSDILNNCDLIDLPGYGTGDREQDDILLDKIKNIDILIYMSQASSFLREEDICWLQSGLLKLPIISSIYNSLKPLSNLYVVASQAQNINYGSITELNNILDKGVERFNKTLSPNYWNRFGKSVELNDFRKRFFTYSTDQASLRKDFEEDFRNLLEHLPQFTIKATLELLKEGIITKIDEAKKRITFFQEILKEREAKKKKLEEMLANEPERINRNTLAKQRILNEIESLKKSSIIDFTTKYNRIINKENIINLIESENLNKKEEDIKLLSQKISNLLNETNSSIILQYSEKFKDLVNEYIKDFEADTNLRAFENNINGKSGFNFIASFAGGMAGMATYGALSVWAASLGNLGAYILVAKGVSILSALGISVGGTATAISAVSAIGGPITIAIGLAILTAIIVYSILLGNWKKSVAEKFIKEYDKQRILEKFTQTITNYWKDTCTAFNLAAENMEKEYKEYLNALTKEINETSNEEIEIKIEAEENKITIYNLLINNLTK